MTVYFGAYLIFAVLGIVDTAILKVKFNKKTRNAITAFLVFLVLFLIVGLRHPSMGVDLGYGLPGRYIDSFHTISKMSWSEVFSIDTFLNYEKGYVVLNKIISTISSSTQFFVISMSFLTFAPIFYVLYRESDSVIFSTIVYIGLPLFLTSYSVMRQCIAISICFLAFIMIKNKKPIKFLLIVLFASLFHETALFFIIAYPIYYIKLNSSLRLGTILILPIVWLFRVPIYSFVTQLLGQETIIDNNGAITLFIVFVLIYVFCSYFEKSEHNGALNIFFVACCIQAMSGLNSIAMRAGYYFIMPLIILIPSIVSSIKGYQIRSILRVLILLCFTVYGLYSIYISGNSWAEAYPYIPFWESNIAV